MLLLRGPELPRILYKDLVVRETADICCIDILIEENGVEPSGLLASIDGTGDRIRDPLYLQSSDDVLLVVLLALGEPLGVVNSVVAVRIVRGP